MYLHFKTMGSQHGILETGTIVLWLKHLSWNSELPSLWNSLSLLSIAKPHPRRDNKALNKSSIYLLLSQETESFQVPGWAQETSWPGRSWIWIIAYLIESSLAQFLTVDFWKIKDFILQLWFYESVHFTLSSGFGNTFITVKSNWINAVCFDINKNDTGDGSWMMKPSEMLNED